MERLRIQKRKMVIDTSKQLDIANTPKQLDVADEGVVDINNNMKHKGMEFPLLEISTVNIENGTKENDSPSIRKFKRKRANLDQLLSQVEAKKKREEDLISQTHDSNSSSFSRCYPTMSKTSALSSPLHTVTASPLHTEPSYSSTASLRSPSTFNVLAEGQSQSSRKTKYSCSSTNENETTSTWSPEDNKEHAKTERKRKHRNSEKSNKRTQNANKRYSSLTSSQLQRRLVANARERSRVHALSTAFNALRCAIPSYSTEQKLSKLTILRVAINYINALEQVLIAEPQLGRTDTEFGRCVDECSNVLQTEYGRSKTKLAID